MDKGLYHIGKGGIPRKCQAVTKTCPYGSQKHFPTKAAAQEYLDFKNKGKSIPQGLSSENVPLTKEQANYLKTLIQSKDAPQMYVDAIREMWRIDRENEKNNVPHKILLSKSRASTIIKKLKSMPNKD